jgi:putative ABC transport system permease protein
MIPAVSWRNVWRNRLRSTVVIVAVALGVFAGVFSTAFMKGMADQRVATAINTELSHIQIHQKGFLLKDEMHLYIKDADKIISHLDKNDSVIAASKRLIITAMASSAETGTGVKIVGINPATEKQVTDLFTKIIEGAYLEGVRRNPIVIGQKLAEKLNIKLHSKIVLTFQDIHGNMIQSAFRVAGIYKTSNSMYDEMNVYVRYSDLSQLVAMPASDAHEIAIKLKSNDLAKPMAAEFAKEYPNLDVKPWIDLSPMMEYLVQTMDMYMYIFIVIILFALLFGIINTMLMVILERVKELGMLMAVGMNKLRIFSMIVFETVFLSLTGGIVGVILSYVAVLITHKTGINISNWSQGLEAMGFDSIVYPGITLPMLINVTLLVICTGIIASIYPARKALKLNPADALRTE